MHCGIPNAYREFYSCVFGNHFLGNALFINTLKAELNPICHLLALLGAHHILHVSRIRVKENMKTSAKESRSVGNERA